MKEFGQRLREARERAGYKSAQDFAAALGLEGHTYRAYERGSNPPNLELIDRICGLLHVTPNYLMPEAAAKGSRPPVNQPRPS